MLGPQGLETRTLTLSGGRVAETGDARPIHVDGLWVMPGIVDLHGDGFERSLAPRRGLVTDLSHGLASVELELAAAGITTAWLAQFWSWEGGMRGPDFARRLATALQALKPDLRLDLRLQLRLERAMLDDYRAVADLVRGQRIDYVVFNDHLPHERLASGQSPPRLAGGALKAGRSPEAHLALMQALAARRDEVPSALARLVQDLGPLAFGSHDDADAEARALWGDLGLRIAEFPMSRAAAEAAQARGEPVVLGAPNVVRGGSHVRGGMAAGDLLEDGLVDALASDYHYPSLLAAALGLVDGGMDVAAAWALVSGGPARIMGLTERGGLWPGARADVILVDPVRRRVVGTFAAGRPVFAEGAFAEALIAA